MSAIVMNTTNGAVTEYGDSFAFNSVTATLAADGVKLYGLSGTVDDGAPIEAKWLGPQLGGEAVRTPDQVYASIDGPAGTMGRVRVVAGGKSAPRGTEWQYDLTVQQSGISRSQRPGQGIRENYLAYGYVNVAGAPYTIDEFEVIEFESKNRKAA